MSVKALQTYLGGQQDRLAQWAVGRITPAALTRFALLEYSRSKALQKCTNESIYVALVTAAQLGLEPGGVTGEAHIVPFRDTATLIPGYKGLIKLALESGFVSSIYSHVVYEGDDFAACLGTDPSIRHEIATTERGAPKAVYAVAKLANSDGHQFEVLNWDDVLRIRDAGGGKSDAWRLWPEQMARKSAIKRLCKSLPLGNRYAKAAALDDYASSGDPEILRRTIDTGEPLKLNAGTEALKGALP